MNKRVSGLIQPPPELVKEITDWVHSTIAHTYIMRYNWFVDDYEKYGDDLESRMYHYDERQISDFKSNIKKCETIIRKSGDSFDYLPYDGKVAKVFGVDLKEWKYLGKLETIPKTKRKKVLSGFNKIRVTLDNKVNYSSYSDFGSKYKQVVISAGTWELNYKKTVVHELRHWTQGLLRNITQNSEAGKPSQKIRTEEITQHLGDFKFNDTDVLIEKLSINGIDSRDFHALDDIEFYTDIGDDIDDLLEIFKRNSFNRKQRLEALKVFTGIKDRKKIEDKKVRENLWQSGTLASLKKSRPKWKKAVKLIVSELL